MNRGCMRAKTSLQFGLGIMVLISLYGCTMMGKQKTGAEACFPYGSIDRIEKLNLEEPSGIVYHHERRSLFIVGDQGDICEVEKDGSLIKKKRIRNADFEGITYNPSSGLLYIVIEGEEKIIESDPTDFRLLREYAIDRTFKKSTVLKAGGHGVEAITFIPNSNHPEGGTFLIANQGFDLKDTEDPSAVFEVCVPLKSKPTGGRARIIRSISLHALDLSGLSYDRVNGSVYAISGFCNMLFALSQEGIIRTTCTIPGENQEGIAVDDRGVLYIAQDSGGIIRVSWGSNREVIPYLAIND